MGIPTYVIYITHTYRGIRMCEKMKTDIELWAIVAPFRVLGSSVRTGIDRYDERGSVTLTDAETGNSATAFLTEKPTEEEAAKILRGLVKEIEPKARRTRAYTRVEREIN